MTESYLYVFVSEWFIFVSFVKRKWRENVKWKKKKKEISISIVNSIHIHKNNGQSLKDQFYIRRNKQKSWCVKTSIGSYFSSYAYNLILEQERLYVGNRLIQAALGWSMGRLPMYRRFYYNAMIIPIIFVLFWIRVWLKFFTWSI